MLFSLHFRFHRNIWYLLVDFAHHMLLITPLISTEHTQQPRDWKRNVQIEYDWLIDNTDSDGKDAFYFYLVQFSNEQNEMRPIWQQFNNKFFRWKCEWRAAHAFQSTKCEHTFLTYELISECVQSKPQNTRVCITENRTNGRKSFPINVHDKRLSVEKKNETVNRR